MIWCCSARLHVVLVNLSTCGLKYDAAKSELLVFESEEVFAHTTNLEVVWESPKVG